MRGQRQRLALVAANAIEVGDHVADPKRPLRSGDIEALLEHGVFSEPPDASWGAGPPAVWIPQPLRDLRHDARLLAERTRRGLAWLRSHGWAAFRARRALSIRQEAPVSWRAWRAWRERQAIPAPGSQRGLPLALLVPVYEPRAEELLALVRSVRAQSYADWQLCLSADGPQSEATTRLLAALSKADARIRVVSHPERLGIAAATSRAAETVQAEVLALVDQDDLLDPVACAALADAFEADPALDFAYTDEDRLSRWGLRESPCFKPGPSPFLALGFNYAMHLMAFRQTFWARIGGARPGFDGAQDHDLLLRALESARRCAHLPVVAYTWRRSAGSVAGGSAAKPWAYEAGRRAVEEACRRRGLPVPVVQHSPVSGVYRWEPEPPSQPLACGLLLLGTDAEARTDWEKAIAASGAFRCEAHGHGTWPATSPTSGLLVVDTTVPPVPTRLGAVARHAALSGVGAVALAAHHSNAREDGWSVSAEGLARAMPDPGLAAAVPHEVATSLGGVLWLAPAPARIAARLADQPVELADRLCLPLAAWAEGSSVLLVPDPSGAAAPAPPELPPRTVDLRTSALWSELAGPLRSGLLAEGADPFCPRHELLVPAGYPPAVERTPLEGSPRRR